MDTQLVASLIAACEWDATRFLIISANVFDPFIYYSHLLPTVFSLAIGVFVFRHDKSLLGKILLVITGLFSVFAIFDLVLWATNQPALTMFFWSVINLIEPMIYAAGLYFVYVIATGKDISFRLKLLIVLPLIPTILLAPTHFNLASFDLSNCDREALEGPLVYYNYTIEILYAAWVVVASALFMKRDPKSRGRIALVAIGIVLFMLAFAWGNIVGSFTVDWQIPQWGLLGMPVFLAFLAYLIVRYNVFHFKVISAQILTFISVALVGSLLFAPNTGVVRIIILPTIIFLAVTGTLLVRSVKREVEQKEQIEGLAQSLENLVHIITHGFKGTFTQVLALLSAIVEGDFGPVPEPLLVQVRKLASTVTKTISTGETILKARNAKTGELRYEMSPFDLREVIQDAIGYVQADILAKGLTLQADISNGDWMVVGDKAQILEHVLRNLITNAVLYTPQGMVKIRLERRSGAIRFAVTDTGVGLSSEDKARLFQEGGKGKDSSKINVHSTGYGLFLAKCVMDAHKGRIWAESEGENKGSTFFAEFPITETHTQQ